MNDFRFFMPTEVFFGSGIVKAKRELFQTLGTRAYIVTYRLPGRHYALEDVLEVLDSNQIPYVIESDIEENPSTETITQAAERVRDFAPEFIVAIGGGSPIDAAKAIGVLLHNPDETSQALFTDATLQSLPLIAIPTTAGTGAEVTHFSVLTRKEKNTKQAISPRIFPRYALLDANYLMEMPLRLSCATAIDALCHCLESYLSTAGNPFSRALCEIGFRNFSECVDEMCAVLDDPQRAASQTPYSLAVREQHMMVSFLGGLVNAQTGTCLPHGMGYALTQNKHIPHGLACGLLIAEYLRIFRQLDNIARVERAIGLCGFENLDDFSCFMDRMLLLKEEITPTLAEIEAYAEEFSQQTHRFLRHPEPAGKKEILQIYTNSLHNRKH